MRFVLKIILWFYLLIALSKVFSQEYVDLTPQKRLSQFPIKSWDMDKGMPSDMVIKLIQSKDGYIWLVTYKGMSRFDGVRFTSYSHSTSSAIESVTIQDVAQDSQGVLWFSSLKGLTAFKDNAFYKDSNLNLLSNDNIESIYYDALHDALWIGTNSKGVFRYDFKKLEAFPDFLNITRSVVKTIRGDENGNIWIGTEEGNIIKYSQGIFKEVDYSEKVNEISSFYSTQSGTIWVATSNGIYTIEKDKLIKKTEISVSKANVVVEDKNKTLWIGSQNGLYRYNLNTQHLDSLNEKMGIPNNLIKDIIVDNEGNLWVATYRKGIFCLTDGIVLNYSENEGLSSDMIISITEVDKDKYYIADEYGAINILDKGTISRFEVKTEIQSDRLKHILCDSNGNLWISTYSGLIKVDKVGREFIYNPSTGFPSITVRLTYEDNQGNIWIGTRSDGLYRLKPDGTYDTFNLSNGLTSNYIMAITQDNLGRIIVTTKNGLNIIESNRIVIKINVEQGLPSGFAFNIHVDRDNVFWLSSNDGIIRIEDDKDIFVFNIHNGLFDNTLFDIIEDENEYFWMPTDIGIVRASKHELNRFAKNEIDAYSYKIFGRDEGMKNPRCMGATKSLRASDGRIFFPTNGGISIVNPEDIKIESYFPNIIIEEIMVNGNAVPRSEDFRVPAGSNRIQINYTALSLKSADKLKYQYRLEPFDVNWIDAGKEHSARYTNIPPGKYIFSVISTDSEGNWNPEVERVKIFIEASWWQTVWFKFLIGLLGASILFAIYKYRMHSIKKQNDELERLVTERTKLIAQQKVEIEEQSKVLEKLSIVASHTNNAILIASADGEILWLNDAFVKFYGYTLDELISQKGKNLAIINDNPKIASKIQQCIANHNPISYSQEITTKSNAKVWIQTTLTPIKDEAGTVSNLVAIDTDITELKLKEAEVIKMNSEMIAQSNSILKQNEEIQSQRDELEQINKLLISHTENIESSIWYALTIQKAILPEKKVMDQFFENFIVFKPRDIVSGDFYWFNRVFTEKSDVEKILVAVIDCTGHGVPGALMSMIGIRLLSEIVNERKIFKPSLILHYLNKQVNYVLKQEVSENIDGMDVALCLIENFKNDRLKITYSGANRPLYILRNQNKEFETIRGNRKTIGGIMPDLDAEFQDHDLELVHGDILILNTDGFIDQNGEDDRKFTFQRMHRIILENRRKSMMEIGDILDIAFDEFRGMYPQRDDATILGIRL